MKLDPYTLEQAQSAVDDAIRRSSKRHNRWRALETLYRLGVANDGVLSASDVPGELWNDLPSELDLDHINLVLPYLSIVMASVTTNDPALLAEPLVGGPEADDRARVAEAAIRHFWRRADGTAVLRDMTHDAVILGPGFSKVGWAHLEREVEREQSDVLAELEALLEHDRRDMELSADPETGERTRDLTPLDELAERVSLTEALVEMDEPFIEYVSPYDVFVPRNARRLDDCRWLAIRVLMPADEVKANGAFDNQARADLLDATDEARPGRSSRDEGHGGTNNDDDPFRDVELFEFYDMRTRTMMVFQRNAERALYEGPIPYSHRYPPLVMMRNFEDGGGRFWPFGDLENVAALQDVYNEFWTEQRGNARRSGNKYAVDADVITESHRNLIESDQSDITVPIEGLGSRPINEVIQSIERKGLSADVYAAKGDAQAAMREVLGLNDFMTGGSGADRMSATAAAVVDGVQSMRAGDKKSQVERAAARMGTLVLLLCQEFLDLERTVKVTGSQEVAGEWVTMTPADLVGEFQVSVEGGSTQAVNPATRQAKALDLIQTVGPAVAQAGFDPEPVLRMAIRNLGFNPDLLLQRPPPPEPEPAPAGGPGMAPSMGGGMPPMPGAGMPPAGGLPPDLAPPALDELAALGGPPVPAAVVGDVAL